MAEILVEVTRGTIVESVFRGDIAVVNYLGEILFSVGNTDKITFFRSSAKPLQALNVILSGAAGRFNLTQKELAVMCASHYAEPHHLETVLSVLKKIGLRKDHIMSGPSTSLNPDYALHLAWNNVDTDQLYSDCSGKHAGMLAVCVHKGYSYSDYLAPMHPCQREIMQAIAYMCNMDERKISTGIDGCSAPVHALPLYNMALGYARLAKPDQLNNEYKNACEQVFDAMNQFPEMISGTNGFCTELIKHTNHKLVGKIGAEGVYGVGLKESGIGIAVKIESGSMAVLPPVVIQILKDLNVLTVSELEALKQFEIIENINDRKNVVGKIRPAFRLK